MSAAEAAITRLFEMLPTLTDIAIRSADTATSHVDHAQNLVSLPAGIPPEQQAPALLRALIDFDHGPGRESHAQKDYEEALRLAEE